MHILNKITDEIIFASAEAETMMELVKEAKRAGVSLREADLCGVDLSWADLREIDLREADLSGANLQHTKLRGANLRRANLEGANLYGADLYATDIRETILTGANLCESHAEIKGKTVIQLNGLAYPVLITHTHVQVGSKTHTFADWRNISKEELVESGGRKALEFYPILIGIINLLCKDREAA